jgi:hypothetical protein
VAKEPRDFGAHPEGSAGRGAGQDCRRECRPLVSCRLSESDPADSHLRLARLLPERVGRRRLSNHDRPRRADSSSDIVPSRRDTWSDKRWDGGHAQDSAPCRGGPVSAFTNQAILRTACMTVTVSTGCRHVRAHLVERLRPTLPRVLRWIPAHSRVRHWPHGATPRPREQPVDVAEARTCAEGTSCAGAWESPRVGVQRGNLCLGHT